MQLTGNLGHTALHRRNFQGHSTSSKSNPRSPLIKLSKFRDRDFDISRSPKVKSKYTLERLHNDFMYVSNGTRAPNYHHLATIKC